MPVRLFLSSCILSLTAMNDQSDCHKLRCVIFPKIFETYMSYLIICLVTGIIYFRSETNFQLEFPYLLTDSVEILYRQSPHNTID